MSLFLCAALGIVHSGRAAHSRLETGNFWYKFQTYKPGCKNLECCYCDSVTSIGWELSLYPAGRPIDTPAFRPTKCFMAILLCCWPKKGKSFWTCFRWSSIEPEGREYSDLVWSGVCQLRVKTHLHLVESVRNCRLCMRQCHACSSYMHAHIMHWTPLWRHHWASSYSQCKLLSLPLSCMSYDFLLTWQGEQDLYS